jgi:hypothetical protein
VFLQVSGLRMVPGPLVGVTLPIFGSDLGADLGAGPTARRPVTGTNERGESAAHFRRESVRRCTVDAREPFLVPAVFVAGLRAVRDPAEERGYAELAGREATSGEAAERRSGLVAAPLPSDRLRARAEASADTPQPISSPR